jgi:hypothetical protein
VILTSGTTYTVPANTTALRIWAIGAGGGGAGSPATDATSGGGGAAGGVAMMTAIAFSPTPAVTLVSSSVPTVTANAITMPAHNEGDVLVMHVHASAANTMPTVPAAGGTVPTWNVLQSTAGNNWSNSRLVWCVGTGTTTSGTWTNADMFNVAVLRGANRIVPIGGNAISAVAAFGGNPAPAITLSNSDGSSQLLHFHSIGDAVNAVGTISAVPVGGYTRQVAATPSTLIGGVLNTKFVTTTDGAVAQGFSGVSWQSSASVEILAPGIVPGGSHQLVSGGGTTTSFSGTYTASLGSDVFIAYSTANAVTVTAITYNSVAMTLVSTVPHNNTAGVGFLSLYRAAAAGTGANEEAFHPSS